MIINYGDISCLYHASRFDGLKYIDGYLTEANFMNKQNENIRIYTESGYRPLIDSHTQTYFGRLIYVPWSDSLFEEIFGKKENSTYSFGPLSDILFVLLHYNSLQADIITGKIDRASFKISQDSLLEIELDIVGQIYRGGVHLFSSFIPPKPEVEKPFRGAETTLTIDNTTIEEGLNRISVITHRNLKTHKIFDGKKPTLLEEGGAEVSLSFEMDMSTSYNTFSEDRKSVV